MLISENVIVTITALSFASIGWYYLYLLSTERAFGATDDPEDTDGL
jgi:hypothetical protein